MQKKKMIKLASNSVSQPAEIVKYMYMVVSTWAIFLPCLFSDSYKERKVHKFLAYNVFRAFCD